MSQSRLFATLLENEITDAEREQLNRLLRDDPELRRLYRKYMTLDAMLRWEIAPPLMSVSEEEREAADSPAGDIILESGVSVPSIIVDPSPADFTFVGSMAFSYMVATVVLCAMLLSAWAYRITHQNAAPGQFVQNAPVGQEMEFVARVTTAADCKWDDPNEGTLTGAWVAIGRKYALASGLLEITYTSGARVILEGPCKFTVDSDAGGYLAVGKLTARMAKNDELGIRNEESKGRHSGIHHSSFINHHLFSVTTPTTVVTDLGTEFGVEVKTGGETQVHVFQGKVRAEWFGKSAAADRIVELDAGQAAEFDRHQSAIVLLPIRPRDFIRAVPRPPAKPVDVAAKKTIVHWSGVYRYGDPTKGTSEWTTLERFGAHHVNDGITDESDVGKAYWLGRERTPDEFFVVYLRGRYSVERIELMNTHNGPGNDRGTKDFEIWAADEVDTENKLVSPRLVLEGTLPCRFGAGADIPYDIFSAEKGDFERFNARYVKFVAKTFYENENKGFGGCGLNEIRLFATPAGAEKE